jgi:hypothetical protein
LVKMSGFDTPDVALNGTVFGFAFFDDRQKPKLYALKNCACTMRNISSDSTAADLGTVDADKRGDGLRPLQASRPGQVCGQVWGATISGGTSSTGSTRS